MEYNNEQEVPKEQHNRLAELVKAIYGPQTYSYELVNGRYVITLGKGKELRDCSFSDKYYKDYSMLFKLTFSSNDTVFEYAGKRNKGKEFNRDIAISNAIQYFAKYGINLNYLFASSAEANLFSKFLLSYINKILNVIFKNSELSNDDFNAKFNMVLKQIKASLNKQDIINAMYSKASNSEIEIIKDSKYDSEEYDKAFPINVVNATGTLYYPFPVFRPIIIKSNDDREDPNEGVITYRTSIKSKAIRYPYNSNAPFHYQNESDYSYIHIWNNCVSMPRTFLIPNYCYFVTCLSKLETESDTATNEYASPIYHSEKLSDEIYIRAQHEVSKLYKQDINQKYMIWLKELNALLGEIMSTEYTAFFTEDKYLNSKYKRGHEELRKFLNSNGMDIQDESVILRYLISRLIDEVCDLLENYDYNEFEKHIDVNAKDFKKTFKQFADYAKSPFLQTAIVKYEMFYRTNHKIIDAFVKQVLIDNPISYYSLIDASSHKGVSYNPYYNLTLLLSSFYTKLNDIIKRLKTAN